MSLSVIIPNFNGRALLERFLPRTLAFFSPREGAEIIVVDDASSDDSVAYLTAQFPQVKVVSHKKNLGFSKSCNAGAKQAGGDILFFLNNDMRIDSLDLTQIYRYLSRNDVFSVTPAIYREENPAQNESVTTGYFKGGWVSLENIGLAAPDFKGQEGLSILWGCGGF